MKIVGPVVLLLAAAIGAPCLAAPAAAPIESVALIDIMPADEVPARAVLERYRADATRGDPGLLSVTLLLQSGSANHYMLVQRFRDRAAFDGHAGLPTVRDFRTALFPFLGSPYDERVGSDVGG